MKLIRQVIQYILPLVIAFLLLGYAYRDFTFSALWTELQKVKLSWIMLSLLLSLASHLVRAYRWKLLLQSIARPLGLAQAFIALNIGYMSNLFVPRLGELVRCSVLKKSTGIATSTALGTVVAERAIDLVSLLTVMCISLVISFKQLKDIFEVTILANLNPWAIQVLAWSSLLLILLLGLFIITIKRSNAFQGYIWLSKVQLFLQGVLQGINSIRVLNTKKTTLVLTICMWVLYYLAGYVGVWAIAETANLGWMAGLSMLAMSSISLTLPIQGGIGAYHLLVSSTLMAYGVSKESSMLYVTLMHSTQLLITFFVGSISLVVHNLSNK